MLTWLIVSCAFAAGVILAVMVIPFIAAVMRDVFELVPVMLKESSYALGSTTWEVVWKVVLPYTKTGVVGGIMLGLGRALGETMAVTMLIGNRAQIEASLLQPAYTIAALIANEFAEADSDIYLSALSEIALTKLDVLDAFDDWRRAVGISRVATDAAGPARA